jgi:endo-1,4-beta-xylanase
MKWTRREVALSIAGGSALLGRQTLTFAEDLALRALAARRGLLFGAATQQAILSSDSKFAAEFIRECAILVPEGELKWNALRPSPTEFDFSKADWLLRFTQQNGLKMRGHTLVWHQSIPKWFDSYVNSSNAAAVMENHIRTTVGHYKGHLQSWDVINEAIEPSDKRPDGLRIHPWFQLLGADYIERVFRLAAEVDPGALLVWNENNIEEDVPYGEAKRTAFVQHLTALRKRNVPIHAIGIQSHLYGDHPNIAGPMFEKFLHQVSDLGLKILITEIDVRDNALPADIAVRDRMVAQKYYQYLTTVLKHRSVIAILSWGLSDKYTWLSSYAPRSDGAPVRPLPLDSNYGSTAVSQAIAKALDEAPTRSA